MTLNDWLDNERGRLVALATHLFLTPAAVTHWKTLGVPLARIKDVSAFTNGEVSEDELLRAALDAKQA